MKADGGIAQYLNVHSCENFDYNACMAATWPLITSCANNGKSRGAYANNLCTT